MDLNTKMLQALISGQSALQENLLAEIKKVRTEIIVEIDTRIDAKLKRLESRLTTRIDRLGLQLARLEDDTPTREEHDQLKKRVLKVELGLNSLASK